MGTGVLPLSLDDPGARVTCGGRALVTADMGNDPPQNGRGLSQAWVRGPVVRRLALHPCSERQHRDGYRGHRGLHRYRASARSEHWATALSRDGRRIFDRALSNDEERLRSLYGKLADHGSLLVVVDQPATIRGPGGGGGPGHGHRRGLPARTVHETHRRPDTGQRQDRCEGRGRVGHGQVNRPGFDGGSDDTEGSLSWDRRSIPMSCASEPRG